MSQVPSSSREPEACVLPIPRLPAPHVQEGQGLCPVPVGLPSLHSGPGCLPHSTCLPPSPSQSAPRAGGEDSMQSEPCGKPHEPSVSPHFRAPFWACRAPPGPQRLCSSCSEL